jgi:hypothetical protein
MRALKIARRHVIVLALAAPFAAAGAATVEVWKSPTCGCCEAWIAHLRGAGLVVAAHNVADMDAVKTRRGVPASLASCHTAMVGGYMIEGHVPAGDIERLLKERPHIRGLAVPGMPQGAPGMASSTGSKAPYATLAIDLDGKTRVFAEHSAVQ